MKARIAENSWLLRMRSNSWKKRGTMSTAGCTNTSPGCSGWEGISKPILFHPLQGKGNFPWIRRLQYHWNEQEIQGKMKFSFILSLTLCPWWGSCPWGEWKEIQHSLREKDSTAGGETWARQTGLNQTPPKPLILFTLRFFTFPTDCFSKLKLKPRNSVMIEPY